MPDTVTGLSLLLRSRLRYLDYVWSRLLAEGSFQHSRQPFLPLGYLGTHEE